MWVGGFEVLWKVGSRRGGEGRGGEGGGGGGE